MVFRRYIHGRNEQGVALVEGAIVISLVFLLSFALIDGAMYMKNSLSIGSAARTSSQKAAGAANDITADYYALKAINKASATFGIDNLDYVVIYKAPVFGDPPPGRFNAPPSGCGASPPVAVAGECNVYDRSDVLTGTISDFDGVGGWPKDDYWPTTNRNSQRSGITPDRIGVEIQGRASTPMGIFGATSKAVNRRTVIQIEARRL